MTDRKLRVLHVTTSFPQSAEDPSGSFVHRLVQALENERTYCHVLTPAGLRCSCWPDARKVHRFRYAPWRWQQIAQQPGGIPQALNQNPFVYALLPSFLLSTAVHLAHVARRYDLVHAHWSVCGALAVLTQPFHRKQVITTLRGSDTHRAKISGSYAWIHRKAISGSRFTIGVGREIMEEAREKYPALSERFSFIPNGVNEAFYAVSPSVRPAPPPLRFLFVGSLIAIKGVDVLLNAFGSLHGVGEWQLTIAGDGPEIEPLMQLSGSLGISGRVSFLRSVPPWKIPSLMAEHHLLVLSSEREGRPNAVLEAMAAALPVLATDVVGTREVVKAGRTGWLVPPNAPRALADMMCSILRSEHDLAGTGMAGRQWMQQQGLTWAKAADRYRLLYEEAILNQTSSE